MRILDELKQGLANLSGKSDIQGNSIGEVLRNFNKTYEPSVGGGNLLSAPITLTCDGSESPTFQNVAYSIGLENGKQYKVEATVDGEEVSTVCGTAYNEGMVCLVGIETEMAYLGNTMLVVYDGCYVENGQPVYDSSYSTMAVASEDEQPHTVILNSITEHVSEAAANLLSEPIVCPASAFANGEVEYVVDTGYALNTTVDKQYQISGTVGVDNTPWTCTATAIYEAENGFNFVMEDEVDDVGVLEPLGVDFEIYDKASYNTGEFGVNNTSFRFTCSGGASDSNLPITIESIIEA